MLSVHHPKKQFVQNLDMQLIAFKVPDIDLRFVLRKNNARQESCLSVERKCKPSKKHRTKYSASQLIKKSESRG